MLRRGEVRIDGRRVRQGYKLRLGEEGRIPPVSRRQTALPGRPQKYLLEMIRDCTLYEDGNVLAINKPAGLAVHSGSGRTFGVIELMRLDRQDDSLQLVHRLDRETSGVLLIAKNQPSLAVLQDCFRQGRVHKQYRALLQGCLAPPEFTVRLPLSRNILRSGERLSAVSAAGKTAETRFRLLQDLGGACLVEVQIKTGRTHQIRVHAGHTGHAIAGDEKYGDKAFNRVLKEAGLKRLFLHAARLQVPEIEGLAGGIRVEAPLPTDLIRALENYRLLRQRPGYASPPEAG